MARNKSKILSPGQLEKQIRKDKNEVNQYNYNRSTTGKATNAFLRFRSQFSSFNKRAGGVPRILPSSRNTPSRTIQVRRPIARQPVSVFDEGDYNARQMVGEVGSTAGPFYDRNTNDITREADDAANAVK